MVRGALSLGGHGGVDQGAASPDLVPGLLLQHARDRLEAEQNLLTVFPVVRRHPRLSLFYIQLVAISKSQKVTLEFHWTWASANMWECFEYQLGLAIKGSLVGLFIWLFPLSDLHKRGRHKNSEANPLPNGFSMVHQFGSRRHWIPMQWYLSVGIINKTHWQYQLALIENTYLSIKPNYFVMQIRHKILENFVIWNIGIKEKKKYG